MIVVPAIDIRGGKVVRLRVAKPRGAATPAGDLDALAGLLAGELLGLPAFGACDLARHAQLPGVTVRRLIACAQRIGSPPSRQAETSE